MLRFIRGRSKTPKETPVKSDVAGLRNGTAPSASTKHEEGSEEGKTLLDHKDGTADDIKSAERRLETKLDTETEADTSHQSGRAAATGNARDAEIPEAVTPEALENATAGLSVEEPETKGEGAKTVCASPHESIDSPATTPRQEQTEATSEGPDMSLDGSRKLSWTGSGDLSIQIRGDMSRRGPADERLFIDNTDDAQEITHRSNCILSSDDDDTEEQQEAPPKPPRMNGSASFPRNLNRRFRDEDYDTDGDITHLKSALSDTMLYDDAKESSPHRLYNTPSQSSLRSNRKSGDLRVSFWDEEPGIRYGGKQQEAGSDEDFLSMCSSASEMSESDYIPRRLLLRRTCTLMLAWFCMGLYTETLSANLPYILTRINGSYAEISRVLATRGVGMFLGAILGGLLGDAFPDWSDLWIASSLLLAAVFTAAAPWCGSLLYIGISSSGTGLTRGFLSSAGTGLMFRLWEDKRAYPIFFGLQIAYSLGAAPTAYLNHLFNSESLEKLFAKGNNSHFSEAITSQGVLMAAQSAHEENNTSKGVMEFFARIPRPMYPFDIAAILTFISGAVFLVYFSSTLQEIPKYKNSAYDNLRKSQLRNLRPSEWFASQSAPNFRIVFYVLVFLVLPSAPGIVFGRWLLTILDMTGYEAMPAVSDRVFLQTAFWLCCAAGCLATIPLLQCRLSPNALIISCYTLLVLSTAMFHVYGHRYELFLWIFVSLTGLCLAPILPAGVTCSNTHLASTSMGMMVAFATVGLAEGLLSWQSAFVLHYFPPVILVYGSIAAAVLGFILYLPLIPALSISKLSNHRRRRRRRVTAV